MTAPTSVRFRVAVPGERCTCGYPAGLVLDGRPVCVTMSDIDALRGHLDNRRPVDTGDAGSR